jgi:heptosyltransferase-2
MGAPATAVTRILVKMPNWVGDCVMATPALALIKTALPGAELDLLVRPSVAGILEDNPHKSRIIAANDRELPADILAQLKSANYDAIALMTNSLGSAWLARKLSIPRRIGFNREGRGLLLTHKIPFRPLQWQSPTPAPLSRRSIKGTPAPPPPRHMVAYYLEIARATIAALGGSPQPPAGMDYHMVLPLHRAAEEKVARLLREHEIQGKVLIGINPGAAHGPAKRWSPEQLGHAVEILSRPDWAIISTAAPGESQLNDAVEATAGVPFHRLGQQVTLRELPALISRFAVLITNDSGPMHIAAARQVPTVAIFGPTDPPSTHPWEAPHQLMRHYVPCSPCFLEECPIDHRCMREISPFDVAAAALASLSNSTRWTPLKK